MNLKHGLGLYRTYMWTLITVFITIVIIFTCTYLPGTLWDMTVSRSMTAPDSVLLDLPDVEEIISASVDSTTIPTYYPGSLVNSIYPDTEFLLERVTEVSEEQSAEMDRFGDMVEEAVRVYYSISCASSAIAAHTTVWNVFVEGVVPPVDTYFSASLVMQQNNVLWNVTVYGTKNTLTYLSRSPYSASDYFESYLPGDQQHRSGNAVGSDETELIEQAADMLYNFLVYSRFFNTSIWPNAYQIIDSGAYNIELSPVENDASATGTVSNTQLTLCTVTFQAENDSAQYQLAINVYQTGRVQVYRLMSISRVS